MLYLRREDARRPSREGESLVNERSRIVNPLRTLQNAAIECAH